MMLQDFGIRLATDFDQDFLPLMFRKSLIWSPILNIVLDIDFCKDKKTCYSDARVRLMTSSALQSCK